MAKNRELLPLHSGNCDRCIYLYINMFRQATPPPPFASNLRKLFISRGEA